MIDQFSQYGYMGVFAAIIATGFGLPLPEELPILTAGVLVGHGDTLPPNAMALDPARLRWWVMLPVCILAVVVGDGLLYAVGRIWGPMLLSKKWVQEKILTAEKLSGSFGLSKKLRRSFTGTSIGQKLLKR